MFLLPHFWSDVLFEHLLFFVQFSPSLPRFLFHVNVWSDLFYNFLDFYAFNFLISIYYMFFYCSYSFFLMVFLILINYVISHLFFCCSVSLYPISLIIVLLHTIYHKCSEFVLLLLSCLFPVVLCFPCIFSIL